MRKSKVQMTAAALMAVILLGGCGEAPYELNDKEEAVIVNYASHVVSKYNTYQREGLMHVAQEAEITEEAEELPAQTETPQEDMQSTESFSGVEGTDGSAQLPTAELTATLGDLFGAEGLTVSYVGSRISDSYMEENYYAMYPDAGKVYLILGIDITNAGQTEVPIDYLTRTPKFTAVVNGQTMSTAEITVLSGDFSALEGTIGAGETRETVLLFQVPDTVMSADQLELFVELAGNNYQIIL